MHRIKIALTAGLCGLTWSAVVAEPLPMPKPLVQAHAASSEPPSPFATLRRQAVQRAMDQETAGTAKRQASLQASLAARKRLGAGVVKAVACAKGPEISEVMPTSVMPGDPVLVTGCGFGDSTGMLLLSEDNRQLNVTRWSNGEIEATLPALAGFAEPKGVTLAVVTVAAGKSAPSPTLTLKPTLVLREIVPVGVNLSGCADKYLWGIVEHATQPGDAPNCTQGTDTVKFGIQLKNNWAFHSLIFTTLCTANHTPCGGANGATPLAGTYQVGKSLLPDLKVNWKGHVAYYPAIMAMGPEGTPAR